MPPDLRGVRVLLVGDWPPPLGGVSVHLRALAEASRKAGALVTILDVGKGQHHGRDVVPSGREARFAASLLTLAARHDLTHLHTSGASPKSWTLTLSVGVAARLVRARSVVTLHSGHAPPYLDATARALLARAALSPYDRVVCVSEAISRALSRIGAALDRHVVAPAFGREGLVTGALPLEASRFRQQHPVVVTAMLAPGRDYGAEELFRAIALLKRRGKPVALAVYGPETDSDAMALRAAEEGVGPFLRLGSIERPQALALLETSDVFVRPTRIDGDAVSVREAMALGTKVVATRAGTRPAGVHLCRAGDAADLARALEAALAAPAPGPRLGRDGIETVLGVYQRLARLSARRAA